MDGDLFVKTAWHARAAVLDSSDAYGQGRNEELIARAVKGRRNEYVIASKFGNLRAADGSPTSDGRPEYVKACCERSLKRLETDLIDLYYIHRVDPTVPIEDTMGAMSELVRQGKVRHLGICEAGAATIRRAHATHPLSAVQIEYSLWTRDVEAEILPLCEELGIGFVAYSPLGRGFLTGNVANIAALRAGDARRNMPRFQGDNLRHNLGLVEELKKHAVAEKCTPAQLALTWVLSRADYIANPQCRMLPLIAGTRPSRPVAGSMPVVVDVRLMGNSAVTAPATPNGRSHAMRSGRSPKPLPKKTPGWSALGLPPPTAWSPKRPMPQERLAATSAS